MPDNKILVLITAQESCGRIIDVAREQARHLSAELAVLTVQPVRMDAAQRSKDMICLTRLSKQKNCPIRIVYSNHPLQSIIGEAEALCPCHIFTGQGSTGSGFLSSLRMAPLEAPISMVGNEGVVFTLPPILEEILSYQFIS